MVLSMNDIPKSADPGEAYRRTIDYLFALQKHGIKLELHNSVRLMEIMGGPHRKFRSVHVAGTNGKGSTSAFIAGMLQAAGLRVGLYTSPHLVNFTERIRIDGAPIPEERVVELAGRVRDGYGALSGIDAVNPTFFEVTTAAAFTYFAEEKIDIAVIEAGMGGRLDATNVIKPLVSVVTNIDIEHTQYLGDTLMLIAAEKAGIIKHGVPVVTGVAQEEAFTVIERTAEHLHAGVYRMGRDFAAERILTGTPTSFDYRGTHASYGDLSIGLMGRHQVDNACLALAAIERLREAGIGVDEGAVRKGLSLARWPGRMECVARHPDIYLDGAHNPASAIKLAETVRELMRFRRRLILVIGILGDKDRDGILDALVPLSDVVVATKPAYDRATVVVTLCDAIRRLRAAVQSAETVDKAIDAARAMAAADDLILVTGSLYVVGEAREYLIPDSGSGQLKGITG